MVRRFPQFTSEYEIHLPELPAGEGGVILWDEVFGAHRPLRIEIGVGNSTFLIEVARRAQQFNYLGFEYSRKRVLKFLKKVEAEGLACIRILPVNVGMVLHHAFLPGSVDHFYINHPDPWPKRRHAKKRFVCRENARSMVRLLRPGGGISMRTDVAAYAAQMLEVMDSTEGLVNIAGRGRYAAAPIEPYLTAFERMFLERGLPIHYLEFEKVSGGTT